MKVSRVDRLVRGWADVSAHDQLSYVLNMSPTVDKLGATMLVVELSNQVYVCLRVVGQLS